MDNKKKYEKIKYYYEDRFDELNENIYGKILKEFVNYNRKYRNKIYDFPCSNEGKFNFIHPEILENKKDTAFFYSLMEKYKYHFFLSILWFIADICNTESEQVEDFLMGQFTLSPYIDSIKKDENIFKIKCIYGEITFQKAVTYFQKLENMKLYNFAKTQTYAGFCHSGAFHVSQNLKESFACTSLCDQAFKGKIYHSFTIYHDKCIDLNFNCIMPTKEYLSLINASILQKIPHQDLEKGLKDFSYYGNDKLLYSALHMQAQDQNLQKKLHL